MEGYVVIENRTNNTIGLAPSFFFFSNYIILLFLWAEAYHYQEETLVKPMTVTKLKNPLLAVQIAMYSIAFVLFVLDFILGKSTNSLISHDVTNTQLCNFF